MPVRIRRAVVQNETRSTVRDSPDLVVKSHFLPCLENFRLSFGKIRLHGKGCLRKVQSRFIVHGLLRLLYRLSHIKFHRVIGRRRIIIQPPPSGLVKLNM